MEDFFLKVWAKNMGAHYTAQNTVSHAHPQVLAFQWMITQNCLGRA